MWRSVRPLVPGAIALLLLGLAVRGVATVVPGHHLLIAVALGALIANTVGVPARVQPAIDQYDVLLETGIVLMGTSLVFGEVLDTGIRIVVLVALVVLGAVVLVEGLSRPVLGIQGKLASLLAAGTAVCGVSAIVATAGAIDAEEKDVTYAVGTVLLFDGLTLFAYPAAASLFGLDPKLFGVWAGLSMFSTGPVTAAGFAYSDVAGTWATVTKLTRNAFLGIVVLGYSLYYARISGVESERALLPALWRNFPKFVLGFVAVIALASLEVLSAGQLASAQHAANWCFTFAFVGMGTQIRGADMRTVSPRPFVAILLSFLAISAITFAAVGLVL